MSTVSPSMSGKVLDGSALVALASGHIGALSWLSVAWTLPLTLAVPRAAHGEALLARPELTDTVRRILDAPVVVGHDDMPDGARHSSRERYETDGVFDPVASWVVGTCRARGWSALTSPGPAASRRPRGRGRRPVGRATPRSSPQRRSTA